MNSGMADFAFATTDPALRCFTYDCAQFDWSLLVFYHVTDPGHRGRGILRTMGSDEVERDAGEAPSVNILRLSLARAQYQVNLPLGMLSPPSWAALEKELIEALTAELDVRP